MVNLMNDFFKRHHYWFMPLIFCLFAYASVAYLAHFKLVYFNSDFLFHLNRIVSIKNNLLNGEFPLISQGGTIPYGATLSFYPWLTIVPFALLSAFIVNKVTLFYTIVAIINLITYLTSYFGYLTISRSNKKAFLFSILYTNSSIIFNWSISSGDMGVTLAMAFAPLALFGFINLMKNNSHSVMMVSGIILMISSHLITGGTFTLTLIFLGIINIRRFKLMAILKILIGIIIAVVITSMFWYPIITISLSNSIVTPKIPKSLSTGIINSVFQPSNFVYGLPEIIGLLSIINFKSKNFKLFDLELWVIGFGGIIFSSYWVADPIAKIFPQLLQLQFSFRFSLISHILLTLLATRFLTNELSEHNISFKMPAIIISMFVIITPIINQYSYQFLMRSRPEVKSIKQYININKPKSNPAQTQFTLSNHSYNILEHYYYNYDYAPNKKVELYEYFDQRFMTSIFNKNGQWQKAVSFTPIDDGIIINNKSYQNIQYPIYIYHGLKYNLLLNGKLMDTRYINKKLTDESYRLTLKNLPRGNNKVSIKSVNFK